MTTQHEAQELELARILSELSETPSPQRPSLDQLVADYPHLEADLRLLWGTAMVVDAVAQHSHRESLIASKPANQNDWQPPDSLGDFRLLDELGRGGMGVVYRAYQESLGREVALKIISRGGHASAVDQERFKTEASAAAQLVHANIIPIFEVGEHQGWQYFAMQLIEGDTLADRIAQGPVPEKLAMRLMLPIVRAVQYAHSRGVIHRDLKPANILLDTRGVPYVTDFGLAKNTSSSSSLTQSGTILGTPSYMSPEQAAGSRGIVGPPSDVYSLGAILYTLLAGRPPHQGGSPVDTVLMVLEQNPLPPRMLNARVSRDVEMIVLKCLQKPVDLRYASAAELAHDVEAYLSGDSISARSGRMSDVIARVFRDTHNAGVLENWGVLWMWHAVVLLVLCVVTNWFHVLRTDVAIMNLHWPYVVLWGGGISVWAPIFWALRHRAGPVTAAERQVAHAWAGSIVAVMLLFAVEALLGYPVLQLSPVLGLINGMVFVMKAGILTGSFYFHAAALFASSIAMAAMQRAGFEYNLTLYGLVSAATFFLPGWKYYRQNANQRLASGEAPTISFES